MGIDWSRKLPWSLLLPLLAAGGCLAAIPPQRDPDYIITNWQTEDGLPENSATAMVQTPDGYLWAGTFGGLVRFDGRRFTVFTPSNTPELPDAGVVNIHLDRSGGPWVSTLKGIARRRDGRWKTFGPELGWAGDYVRHFGEGADGSLYVTTFDHHVLEFARERFTELPQPPGDPRQENYLYVDPAGHLHMVRHGFFSTWRTGKWESVALPGGLATRGEFRDGMGRDGTLWSVKGDQLWRLDHGRVVSRVRLDRPIIDIWSVIEDRPGVLWICSYRNGLFRVTADLKVRRFSTASGLVSDNVRFAFLDRDGTRWIGTSGGGLARFRERRFQAFDKERGLPDVPMRTIAADRDGSLFFGTYGSGMFRVRGERLIPIRLPGPVSSYIQTILPDRLGRIWVGTYGGGLYLLEAGGGRRIPHELGGGATVEALWEDSRGRIWIAGNRRLAVFENGSFTRYEYPSQRQGIPVRSFAENPRTGEVWMGGDAGLFRFHDGQFQEVNDAEGRPQLNLTAILPDRDSLWLGTTDRGLLHWRGGTVTAIGADRGLGAQRIAGVIEEGGYLWIASHRGIWRARKADLEALSKGEKKELDWQVFGLADGLPSLECQVSQQSVMRGSDGRLWFATLRGFAVIDPSKLVLNTSDSPVKIEDLAYLDNGLSERLVRLSDAAGVAVPAGSRNIQISYTALDLADAEKVLFSYKLEQGGRTIAGGRRSDRSLHFPRLSPGDYRLTIGARNSDGFWSRQTAELRFSIQPFVWERWGFWLALALLAAGSIGLGAWWIARARVRREMEVAALRARLALVLENTSETVWFETPERKMIFMNRAARRILGLGEDEDIGGLHPREFQTAEAAELIDGVALPAVHRAGSWQGYSCVRHRNGQEIPIWQLMVAHHGSGGEVEFISSMGRDMTELKKAETALRSSEEKFSKAFQASPDALSITRLADGRILEVNEGFEKVFGCRSGGAIGKTAAELRLFVNPPESGGLLEEVKSNRRVKDQEVVFNRQDGGQGTALVSLERIELRGEPFALMILHDVTERVRLEEQMRQAHKMESVGRLAGGVAHDFNNLLTVINGYAEFARESLPEGDPARDSIGEISKAGARAAELTRQLLAFSRKQIVEPKRVNLNQLISESRNMLGRIVGEDIELVTSLDPALHPVMADPGQLSQVMMNLVVNAREAMPRGGRLTIKTAPEAPPGLSVLLIVSDTGVGMSEEVRRRVFEPFFTAKGAGQGTGLGLATVYGIVQQCGGWIRLESEPGRGATFTVGLPPAASPDAAELGKEPPLESLKGSETVVVTEDEDEVRKYTVAVLQRYGYRVLEAGTGSEALLLAKRHAGPIHLLLTDVIMPHMTGKELADRLKLSRPETQILFMSGYSDEVIAHRGRLDPGTSYIPKPFHPEELARKVKKLLAISF